MAYVQRESNQNAMNEGLITLQWRVITFLWCPTNVENRISEPMILTHWVYKIWGLAQNLVHMCMSMSVLALLFCLCNELFVTRKKSSFGSFTLEMSLSCVLLLMSRTKVASEPSLNLKHTHTQHNKTFLYFSMENIFTIIQCDHRKKPFITLY